MGMANLWNSKLRYYAVFRTFSKISLTFWAFFKICFQFFKIFLELTRSYYNVSKASSEKCKIFMKFLKEFSKLLLNYFKMFQNFRQIILQTFWENTYKYARFFRFFSKLVYCVHFWKLFQYFRKTVFRIIPNFFQNFIKFLHNLPTLAVSQKLIIFPHILLFFVKSSYFLRSFSKVTSKFIRRFIKFPLHFFFGWQCISVIFIFSFLAIENDIKGLNPLKIIRFQLLQW